MKEEKYEGMKEFNFLKLVTRITLITIIAAIVMYFIGFKMESLGVDYGGTSNNYVRSTDSDYDFWSMAYTNCFPTHNYSTSYYVGAWFVALARIVGPISIIVAIIANICRFKFAKNYNLMQENNLQSFELLILGLTIFILVISFIFYPTDNLNNYTYLNNIHYLESFDFLFQ